MKAFVSWASILFSLAAIIAAQYAFDSSTKDFQATVTKAAFEYREPLLPSTNALKIIGWNNQPAIADALWLQTIQYFGGGNPYGEYNTLGPILETITTLDPKFAYPYEFALIVLPFMNQTDIAIAIGERAQEALPENGLITYYLATVYHLEKKDYENAAKYYEKASNLEGAPGAAKQLAAISLSQLDNTLADRIVAMEFWRTVHENADDPDEKERAANWMTHMQLVYQIEYAAGEYKKNTGNFPVDIETLVINNYLPGTPQSPIKRELALDPETGRVNFDNLVPDQE